MMIVNIAIVLGVVLMLGGVTLMMYHLIKEYKRQNAFEADFGRFVREERTRQQLIAVGRFYREINLGFEAGARLAELINRYGDVSSVVVTGQALAALPYRQRLSIMAGMRSLSPACHDIVTKLMATPLPAPQNDHGNGQHALAA